MHIGVKVGVFMLYTKQNQQYGTTRWNNLRNIAKQGGTYGAEDYSIIGVKKDYYVMTSSVAPLLSTQWDQWTPTGTACYAGCVTVSLAQIMRYYEKPVTVAWYAMPNTYSSTTLLNFFKAIGDNLGLDYTTCSVGANDTQITKAFKAFDYNVTISNHSSYDVKTYLQKAKPAPVSMGGFTSSSGGSGHQWVCDGFRIYEDVMYYFVEFLTDWGHGNYVYDQWQMGSSTNPQVDYLYPTTFHHMNWGYGGSGDGWFYDTYPNAPTGNFQYKRTNAYATPK